MLPALKTAWEWLRDHWYVPLIVLGALASALLGGAAVRELRRPDRVVRKELEAVNAGKKAAQLAVDTSAEFAVKAIEDAHRSTIDAFDEMQKAKMVKLRGDPASLAAHLARLTS